jgi:hypothetical protein
LTISTESSYVGAREVSGVVTKYASGHYRILAIRIA